MAFQKGNKLGKRFQPGYTPHNKGKKLSKETIQRIKEHGAKFWLGKKRPEGQGMFKKGHKINLGKHWKVKDTSNMRGENCHLWKGGISFEPYSIDWTKTLRESIRQRDNYICKKCGIHQDELIGRFKKLDIHHIDYDKLNVNPENLITLCRNCHIETNGNREYWTRYFNN